MALNTQEQLVQLIKELSQQLLPELIEVRRHIHKHPELSFKEYATTQYIASQLHKYELPILKYGLETGLISELRGKEENGSLIALRADIDALPIHETNDCVYQSIHDGVMHACGHDVHTTCLLGAMIVLQKLKHYWNGKIKFVFQPGEEKSPGGATLILASGALDPKPDYIFGLHVHPALPVGQVGGRAGMFMASSDELTIVVTGKGGHAAIPDQCIDPILISANIVTQLQSLLQRTKPVHIPAVLSIGHFESLGGTYNVIPSQVKMLGTFRTMNEDFRSQFHAELQNYCKSIGKANNAEVEVIIEKGYPYLVNDIKAYNIWESSANLLLDTQNVLELPIRMTAEDFAFYTQSMKGCFFRLGTGNKDMGDRAVHTSNFDIDENAIAIGVQLLVITAINALSESDQT